MSQSSATTPVDLTWRRLGLYLGLLGIFSMPLMSVPIMPSDYRPLSCVFFLFPGLFYIARIMLGGRSSSTDWWLIGFLFCATAQALVMTGFMGLGIVAALKGITPIILGVCAYFAMKNTIAGARDASMGILVRSIGFVLIVGLIEVLAIVHVVPMAVKEVMGLAFSGISNARLQLTTQEASWAVRILMFSAPVLLYQYKITHKVIYKYALLLLAVLFVFAFSLDGISAALFAWVMYMVLARKLVLRTVLKALFFLTALVALFYFVLQWLEKFDGNLYYIARIAGYFNLENFSATDVAFLDGSTFIRVFYPIIAFKIFLAHPLGVGAGNFPVYFNNLISKDYADAMSLVDEVAVNFYELSGSPKSLYARLAAENGLISGPFFVVFVLKQLRMVRRVYDEAPRDALASLNLQLFCVGLASVFQFASFAYVFMWFAFALNSCLYRPAGTSGIDGGEAAFE